MWIPPWLASRIEFCLFLCIIIQELGIWEGRWQPQPRFSVGHCGDCRGVSLLQDATPPAEHNATADHLEGDDLILDLISYQRHANTSWCLIPATTRSNKRPWGRQEALTYVFARYAHGSALLHLACLHDDTHHYWVTGVENKLREYFHLAREYCYMPGRQQGGGILKRLLEQCGEY